MIGLPWHLGNHLQEVVLKVYKITLWIIPNNQLHGVTPTRSWVADDGGNGAPREPSPGSPTRNLEKLI